MQLCREKLVRSIMEVQKMDNTTQTCDKLKQGDPRHVIPTSYIVLIKPHNNMSEVVSDMCKFNFITVKQWNRKLFKTGGEGLFKLSGYICIEKNQIPMK